MNNKTELERIDTGKFRRKSKRLIGVFIDGTSLDRATRRINRKVDLHRFVSSLGAGLIPEVAKYYTLIPHEDDARQFAFLDAVERAGLDVCTKRLPPKNIKRIVSVDANIAVDMLCFALGKTANDKNKKNQEKMSTEQPFISSSNSSLVEQTEKDIIREIILVCPSRDLSYATQRCHELGVRNSLADFGVHSSMDSWRGIDTWIDLSTSETIWKE